MPPGTDVGVPIRRMQEDTRRVAADRRGGPDTGAAMSIDRDILTSTDAGADVQGRGFRAFGLLRRREVAEPTADPRSDEPRPMLRYTEDPDVARRIALYVGQTPGDTDLAWIEAS